MGFSITNTRYSKCIITQPSQNVSEELVILKLEAVWLLRATFRAPVGREHLGGSGKFLKLDTQWCDLVQSGGPEG